MPEFNDIRLAIGICGEQVPGDEWFIDESTVKLGLKMVDDLEAAGIPCPLFFTHGSDAVTFTWNGEHKKVYLTVGDPEPSFFIWTHGKSKEQTIYCEGDLKTFLETLRSHLPDPIIHKALFS